MAPVSLRQLARHSGCSVSAVLSSLPIFALSLPLCILLTGCPASQPVQGAPAAKANATAPPIPAAQSPGPAQPAVAPPTPQQRQAQERSTQLIARVDHIFSSGEGHYRRGELTQAKADFDQAVDLMLSSGLDVKADPQLDDEFNRILDAVNALEMEALSRGNGFSPAVEPTPAEVANDVTFEVDPNIVAKAKSELATTKSDLPLVINDYVAAYINFFANTQRGHNTLLHSFQRSGRYKDMIQRTLQEEGLPQDLIYLAVAESAFQPHALNPSGAGGMWQFMPHGDYGLTRNGYVDERFDPEKSTHAYARYMKFLYNQLGDWYLAMAAYDWGAGSIQRAVQKTGYADFWELYKRNNLPGETKDYVPKIIAAIIISRNLKQYGFDDIALDPPIVTDTVPIDYAVDMHLVADIVDADPQELMALNPGLLRLTTPPPGILSGPFDLHLPPGTATLFRQRISEIPEGRRAQWRYHRVTGEDSLASVARSYHVSVGQLATVNQLEASDSLENVEALVVPVPPPAAAVARSETYRARRGDTLVKIADRFGVTLDDLRRWNHLAGIAVTAGQRIRVTEPLHLPARTVSQTHARSGSPAANTASAKQKGHAAPSGKKQKAAPKAANEVASAKHPSSNSSGHASTNKKSQTHTKTKSKKNVEK
jgi:membrane-bound lytic murein transglycosylase D